MQHNVLYMVHARTPLPVGDPAPALGRGLTLLATLDREGACSLEQLARVTGWPKSSVARLLKSLVLARTVRRDAVTKRFSAVCRLTPVDAGGGALRRAAGRVMAELAESCGHTVELHAVDAARPDRPLIMIDRCEPPWDDVPVRVIARIGFERDLHEIDALTQVALVWGRPRIVPHGSGNWAWQHGRRLRLTRRGVLRLIDACEHRGAGVDEDANEHGVCRCAAPIVDGEGRLVAVLAIARFVAPVARASGAAALPALRDAAARIADELSPAFAR